MSAPAVLRLATTGDIPALQNLINDSVRALSTDHYTQHQIEAALVHVFGVDSQLIHDETYFVAEVDGMIVGAGGWSKRNTLFGGDQLKTGHDDLLVPGMQPARLRAFYVHPKWARRGIGKQLTQACEGGARAAGFTRMELVATLPGLPLYQASGYQTLEPYTIVVSDNLSLPAFLMGKDLT